MSDLALDVRIPTLETQTLASDPVLQAICPLALQMRRVAGSVVGRPAELAALDAELASGRAALSSVTVEGEPGIGKTRLLLAGAEIAAGRGFTTVAVAADEELRGPFLLLRSLLSACSATHDAGVSPPPEIVQRALEAMSGRDDPALEGLPADQKLLRIFDLAALALRVVAAESPLAMFVDDLQWADDDSLRALRYVIRTDAGSPIFVMLALRPEETALISEAINLIADMERMGLVRRLKLGRFSQVETADFLRQLLGGQVHLPSAAVVHAQAEGVPFIIEEIAHAYRDSGMVQEVDGVWTLARNAERLVPSAVQTLIQRRSGRLPDDTRSVLAEAAVLGRSLSLRDLSAVRERLGDPGTEADQLADWMSPAVRAGLLAQHPAGAPADYSFNHEQVRQFALATLSPPRRRAIHAAVVDMLTEGGEPAQESLPLLAHHAAAAGDAERSIRFGIESARIALASRASEEVLRAVDLALPLAAAPQDRVTLLRLRDDALEMLRRPSDRLEGLSELAALAEALGEPSLELESMLRRAAALRLADESDRAAELARQVRDLAASRGDRRTELAATLELGQNLVGSPLGEGFVPSALEFDLEGADEAFRRAVELAEGLGDEASLAAALRELGVVQIGRQRGWFVEQIKGGELFSLMARGASGESTEALIRTLPIAPIHEAAERYLGRALELFEKIGDRRGTMSTVIALAYQRYGPEIHIGNNAVQRIEEIRRLSSRMGTLARESERAMAEAQMMYGVHVFARAKGILDLAISRGEEAHRAAKVMGDRSLEFLSAGGVAMAHVDLGDEDEAERWLASAAAVAAAEPTPLRTRQLEFWRGVARAAVGDTSGMRDHLGRALRAATEQGRPAARCEVLARLAIEAARLGAATDDEELLALAERSAGEAKDLMGLLPAHPPWGAQADAALAEVALARGDLEGARRGGMAVVDYLMSNFREDLYPEMVLPTGRALLAAGHPEERELARSFLRISSAVIAQRTLDDSVRVRWFRSPIGRELVRLAGAVDPIEATDGQERAEDRPAALDEHDSRLLGLLTEGLLNREIADRLGVTEEEVVIDLQKMFARIGASSRADATVFALAEGVL